MKVTQVMVTPATKAEIAQTKKNDRRHSKLAVRLGKIMGWTMVQVELREIIRMHLVSEALSIGLDKIDELVVRLEAQEATIKSLQRMLDKRK